jgi:hypothetical protein
VTQLYIVRSLAEKLFRIAVSCELPARLNECEPRHSCGLMIRQPFARDPTMHYVGMLAFVLPVLVR